MEDDGYDHSALDYLLNWSFRCFQMLVMFSVLCFKTMTACDLWLN
jgi:hypothetical protein